MFDTQKLNDKIAKADVTLSKDPTESWQYQSASTSKYRAETMLLLSTDINAFWNKMIAEKRYPISQDYTVNNLPQIVMAHELGCLDLFSEKHNPIEVHLINTPGAYWMEHSIYFVFQIENFYVGVSFGMRYQVESLIVAKDKKYLDLYFYRKNTIWNNKERVEWTNQPINVGSDDIVPRAVYNCVREFLDKNVNINDGFIDWDYLDTETNISTLDILTQMNEPGWELKLQFTGRFNYKESK